MEKANDLVFVSANLRMLCRSATPKADPFTQWEMEQEGGQSVDEHEIRKTTSPDDLPTTTHDHEANTSYVDSLESE